MNLYRPKHNNSLFYVSLTLLTSKRPILQWTGVEIMSLQIPLNAGISSSSWQHIFH